MTNGNNDRFSFNVNYEVYVRLTQVGRKELQRQHLELYLHIGKPNTPYVPPVEDAGGWSKWSMWDLMNRLGPLCQMGCDVPFETTVEFARSTLTPHGNEPCEQHNPFDSAAILAAPRERRISMSFQTQEQYEAALVFLDMADEGASRDASSEPCEHLRSEFLAEKPSAEPPFEMRKCLDCTKIFRKRLTVKSEGGPPEYPIPPTEDPRGWK